MDNLPIELNEQISEYLACLHTKSPLPRFSKNNLSNLLENLFRVIYRGFPLDDDGMKQVYKNVKTQVVYENILHLHLQFRCQSYQNRTYNFYVCRSKEDRKKITRIDLDSSVIVPPNYYLAWNSHKRIKVQSYKNIKFKTTYYVYAQSICIDDPLTRRN
jgi:hypothetical protein